LPKLDSFIADGLLENNDERIFHQRRGQTDYPQRGDVFRRALSGDDEGK
jgi:hypothetical protein